ARDHEHSAQTGHALPHLDAGGKHGAGDGYYQLRRRPLCARFQISVCAWRWRGGHLQRYRQTLALGTIQIIAGVGLRRAVSRVGSSDGLSDIPKMMSTRQTKPDRIGAGLASTLVAGAWLMAASWASAAVLFSDDFSAGPSPLWG